MQLRSLATTFFVVSLTSLVCFVADQCFSKEAVSQDMSTPNKKLTQSPKLVEKLPTLAHGQTVDLSEIDKALGDWIPRPTLQHMLRSGIFTSPEVLRITSLEKAKSRAEAFHREGINQLNRELNLLTPSQERLFKIRKNIDAIQVRLTRLNDNLFFFESLGYQRAFERLEKIATRERMKSITARN